MAVPTQSLSPLRRSNHRASFAFLCGVVAVAVIPVAIELTRRVHGAVLMDAVWAIPVAAGFAVASLLFGRGARGALTRTLGRARGSLRIRLGHILAVAGICLTLSASVAVGLYELLLRLER